MQVESLESIPPDRITRDHMERRLYSRDLAPVPALLVRPFFDTLPDAVVRPGSAEQVAALLRHANREGVAVTPRAAASTSLYNAVPVRGGLVLDVNGLRGGVDLDPTRQTVRALPATTWCELDDALRPKGYAARSYPSSAVAATVGGWVSTQGQGIGSLEYGSLGSQLVRLQVALPSGELLTVARDTDPPLDWFVAAEGTLGVVTEIELGVRPIPEAESHHLFAFRDPGSLGAAALAMSRAEPRPYTVFFADEGFLRLLARAGFSAPLDTSESAAAAIPTPAGQIERSARPGRPPGAGILLVSFQGGAREVARGRDGLAGLPGLELSDDLALEEWNARLYHLRAKRAAPSLLGAEQWLPLEALGGYLGGVRAVAGRERLPIGSYGVAVAPEWAMVMSVYPADERRPLEYMAAIGLTECLYDLGAAHGGRPYGVGLWNLPYLPRIFDRATLEEMKSRKARLDPRGIMNPGKLYRPPFPLWPQIFGPGARLLAAAYPLLRRRG